MRRPGTKPQLLVFTLGMVLGVCCVAAEIYRWTDANGKTHFGDRPNGLGASAIKLTPSHARSGAAPDRTHHTERLLEEFVGERAQREADRKQARDVEDKRRAGCEQAKTQALELNEATYLYDRDQDGTRRILGEADLRKARDSAREAVARMCD